MRNFSVMRPSSHQGYELHLAGENGNQRTMVSSGDCEDVLLLSEGDVNAEPVARGSRTLRRGSAIAVLLLIVGAVVVASFNTIRHPDFLQAPGGHLLQRDAIGFFGNEFYVAPSCPDDGGVCLCYVTGTFTKTTECKSWKYQVGDVVNFGTPGAHFWFLRFAAGYFSALVQHSPIIHSAIVVSVPPAGTRQTPQNIILGEAIDPQGVVKSTLMYAVERYNWGSIYLKRVDPARFPLFHTPDRLSAIQQWTHVNIGHAFDNHMINPFFHEREQQTGGRYIPVPPTCAGMQKALGMYNSNTVTNWMCSQFVTWSLAFAGGLNTDYGAPVPGCTNVKKWTIENVQQFPGDLFNDADKIFQPGDPWMTFCGNGCFPGMPMSTPHGPTLYPNGYYLSTGQVVTPVEYPIAPTTPAPTTPAPTTPAPTTPQAAPVK